MAISDENKEWIATIAAENEDITFEMVQGWFEESVDNLKTIGLDNALDETGFLEMARTGTIGKLQANITVKPTDFRMMILGPYPEKLFNNKASVDIIAFATPGADNETKMSKISAWESFVSVKNDIKPLTSYKTGMTHFEKENETEEEKATFNISVQSATKFSKETEISFVAETYDEKLEKLRNIIPKVDTGAMNQNVSRPVKSKNDKYYPSPVDIKRIVVEVVGTADGIGKDGRPWAMYHVLDGTFKPTIQSKHVAVWVDLSIFERLQAGEGSLLEIYGMIQANKGDGSISMSACFIHPLAVKPLEHKVAQTDEQNVYVPAETPQIQVMMSGSDTEMGM